MLLLSSLLLLSRRSMVYGDPRGDVAIPPVQDLGVSELVS